MVGEVWIEANMDGVSCLSPGRLIEPKLTATFVGAEAEGFERLCADPMFTQLMASAMRQVAESKRSVGSKLGLVDGLEG